jgi:hypothetical protein
MKKHVLTLVALAALPVMASTTISADSYTLNATPTQFSTTVGKVQKITFRAIPGYCGKIYIGGAAMNTSTYANVFKVLWPDCNGGIVDEYSVEDYTGANSLDTSAFYIAGDIPGEKILWETLKTGCNSNGCPVASNTLRPLPLGPVHNTSATQAAAVNFNGTGSLAMYQFATVPGLSGKIRVGDNFMSLVAQPDPFYHNTAKVLWPLTAGMTKTDFYELRSELLTDPYGLIVGAVGVFTEVNGEFVLLTAWQYV